MCQCCSLVSGRSPAAVEQGADAELQFPVEGVELEFQVAMTVEGQTGSLHVGHSGREQWRV